MIRATYQAAAAAIRSHGRRQSGRRGGWAYLATEFNGGVVKLCRAEIWGYFRNHTAFGDDMLS